MPPLPPSSPPGVNPPNPGANLTKPLRPQRILNRRHPLCSNLPLGSTPRGPTGFCDTTACRSLWGAATLLPRLASRGATLARWLNLLPYHLQRPYVLSYHRYLCRYVRRYVCRRCPPFLRRLPTSTFAVRTFRTSPRARCGAGGAITRRRSCSTRARTRAAVGPPSTLLDLRRASPPGHCREVDARRRECALVPCIQIAYIAGTIMP